MTAPAPHLVLAPPAADAPSPDSEVRISAIDIGSNSIRQVIADVSGTGSIRIVDEMKTAPRLGAGVAKTGALDGGAMHDAIETLSRMAALSKQQGAKRIEAVATSAVREASNGAAFVARVKKETGLRIRILDTNQEAMLSFRSALAHFELGAGRAAVMDIGGGSLELVLSAEGLVEDIVSFPFGAVRLTEQFLAHGDGLAKLRKHVRAAFKRDVPARIWRSPRLIGSGGTFTNLASIHLARTGLESARSVQGAVVSRVEVEHILDHLNSLSQSERQSVPGLNPDRADIIVAGVAVIAEVLARLGCRELTVSAYGIREGLLLESARVSPTIADPGSARERSVRELAERTHYEKPHAERVQKLALKIFDSIGDRLDLTDDDRRLLSDAALLHDIGYHIDYDEHHKHSYHLITHAALLGMEPTDQVAIANIARYHRGPAPKKSHGNLESLSKSLRKRIKALSAILRVADGFDRGHAGAVADVKIRWTSRALRITAVPQRANGTLKLELWGATRKAKLLSKVAGAPVEIIDPSGRVVSAD